MNIEKIREYCLSKKDVTESFPFDDVTLVFKVMGKMFALLSLKEKMRMNLKCEPDRAVELRERYEFILPGYHMNKKHWNTVEVMDERLVDELLKKMIDDSYGLVVRKNLTKKQREELENL